MAVIGYILVILGLLMIITLGRWAVQFIGSRLSLLEKTKKGAICLFCHSHNTYLKGKTTGYSGSIGMLGGGGMIRGLSMRKTGPIVAYWFCRDCGRMFEVK